MLATTHSSLFGEAWSVPHASVLFASGATRVWFAMHAFFVDPHPCKEVAVRVAYDVCEDVEINSVDERVAPRKPDKRHGVARMQAKLVMDVQRGKLWDCTKPTLSNCLDVLGVKLPSGSNRGQAKEIAMQHAVPLLA